MSDSSSTVPENVANGLCDNSISAPNLITLILNGLTLAAGVREGMPQAKQILLAQPLSVVKVYGLVESRDQSFEEFSKKAPVQVLILILSSELPPLSAPSNQLHPSA